MPRPMRISTKPANNGVMLRVRIKHPMETGLRKDKKTGRLIPPHFIQSLIVSLNGKTVVNTALGTAISKNPVFKILIHGAKTGDTLSVSWTDNLGEKGSTRTTVN